MKRFRTAYNIGIVVLAVVSVIMALADLLGAPIVTQAWFYPVDTAILVIFAIDYITRFFLATQKWNFFKHNIFDLIAIIPFNAIFSVFRFFRVFRILRLAKITKLAKLTRLIGVGGRLRNRASSFLHTNGLIYIIYLNIASIFLGAVCIYLLEKDITVHSFSDSIWWAFVTATTVGYGDISPSTTAGRIVAAVLMICGIGLISMLTGTVATYFTRNASQSAKEQQLMELKDVASTLSPEQISVLIEQAKSFANIDSTAK